MLIMSKKNPMQALLFQVNVILYEGKSKSDIVLNFISAVDKFALI